MRSSDLSTLIALLLALTVPRTHGLPGPGDSRGPPAAAVLKVPKEIPSLPLRTEGRFIVDSNGSRVKLRCVSWSGAQVRLHLRTCSEGCGHSRAALQLYEPLGVTTSSSLNLCIKTARVSRIKRIMSVS